MDSPESASSDRSTARPELSDAEYQRYSRHLLVPEIGVAGQRRLRAARVLIVGAGGLGSPAALYLAAAGVGTIQIVDADIVDLTNLQRQILYATADVGRPKVEAGAERLRALNSHIAIEQVGERFSLGNARRLVAQADVVVDGTDNFPARYLVNDACVLSGTPNVFGSIARFEGQASVFAAPGGPCYRCLHPEPPEDGLIANCAETGVLGVLPGVIGTIQAAEAIKIVCGTGAPLVGRLLLYDAWRMRFREIVLPRDRDCPICGDTPTIRELAVSASICETSASPTPGDAGTNITVDLLRAWRRAHRPHLLIDVREPSEHARAAIDGSILIPIGQLDAGVAGLPRDRPVVVHCQTGQRSARATTRLRSKGFDARNLSGGLRAWVATAEAGDGTYK